MSRNVDGIKVWFLTMKKNIQGKGYNKGDQYEDKITNILINSIYKL